MYFHRSLMRLSLALAVFFSAGTICYAYPDQKAITIIRSASVSPREKFGITKLVDALVRHQYKINIISKAEIPLTGEYIIVSEWDDPFFKKAEEVYFLKNSKRPGKEGFFLTTIGKKNILIAGADPSGVLYGCLELAARINNSGKVPAILSVTDQPEMVLRGACIGLQKPYYLPGRTVYEYPYTPETFPWFYDKKLWIQYLDSMVSNRMNSLYLWNGHPFASLVRLKDYPFAVEVDSATFRKNEEIYRFLTTEADKRGIWVIQMFYNIIVSKPFADHYHIKTQDRERHIIPLIADYTRKSIAAFVKQYPNAGLMVCLGEAMEGTGNDDVEWFAKTIIPGVQDGMKALGKTEEPPIVLRAHDTDAPAVMKAALPLYKNLYTVAKFNGEALTTYEPRGAWAELHRTLSRIGTVQIENVHILANLEPFRYGAIDFIQKSVQGMHSIMEANGLHLYPQASYWDWPYSADSTNGKLLLELERDWIWYAAWSRYAWKSNRDREEEINYWSSRLAARFGCSREQGRDILEAYEESGEIAPKLLRRFGITDGNRQTLSLGMLMTQLINPERYGLYTLLYDGESPEGEMLTEYAAKEWKNQNHTGETPVQIINEVRAHGNKAVDAIRKASQGVKKNKEEFARLSNDMHCYKALADHYALKAKAALYVLRYKYSDDIDDLDKALPYLEQSLASYKQLVNLTKGTYRYANSMQTQQRKIPLRGVNGAYKTWIEVMAPFETELEHFKHAIDSLKKQTATATVPVRSLTQVKVASLNITEEYIVDSAVHAFTDLGNIILTTAKELRGLHGLPLSFTLQVRDGTLISFVNKEPVKLLVGFFHAKDTLFLKEPELETNASANEYGQAETMIANAIVVRGMPPVNVHSYSFPPGTHTLQLARGACLLLGFVDGNASLPVYDAGLTENGPKKKIDWLFE